MFASMWCVTLVKRLGSNCQHGVKLFEKIACIHALNCDSAFLTKFLMKIIYCLLFIDPASFRPTDRLLFTDNWSSRSTVHLLYTDSESTTRWRSGFVIISGLLYPCVQVQGWALLTGFVCRLHIYGKSSKVQRLMGIAYSVTKQCGDNMV